MSFSVAISGVSGFVGRRCAQHFSAKGYDVFGIDRVATQAAPVGDLSLYRQIELPSAELDNFLAETAPSLFVHCAGSASVPRSFSEPRHDFLSGPVLTWEILDSIRRCSSRTRFILLSSAAVYGNPNSLPVKETSPMAPISPYGAHKLQCELICREFHDIFGVSTSSLRIFSAYGPGLQRQVMWDLCRQAITCREIKAQGTGRESRDFVHVSDICNAIDVVASTAPLCGEVYNLGSGTETTIAGLGSMIIQALGGPCAVSFDGFVPPGTPLNWRADISALRDLGFQPSVEIDQGVAAYAAWCRSVIE